MATGWVVDGAERVGRAKSDNGTGRSTSADQSREGRGGRAKRDAELDERCDIVRQLSRARMGALIDRY